MKPFDSIASSWKLSKIQFLKIENTSEKLIDSNILFIHFFFVRLFVFYVEITMCTIIIHIKFMVIQPQAIFTHDKLFARNRILYCFHTFRMRPHIPFQISSSFFFHGYNIVSSKPISTSHHFAPLSPRLLSRKMPFRFPFTDERRGSLAQMCVGI